MTTKWPATPMLLANGLVWLDVFIPTLEVYPIYLHGDLADGFHAHLPTENEAHVDLTFDPANVWEPGLSEYYGSGVSQWLYVASPVDDRIVGGRIAGNGRRARILYDQACIDLSCDPLECDHCPRQWWTDVSTPEEVLDNLGWLGSLPVEAS